jgi:hypothetical protein
MTHSAIAFGTSTPPLLTDVICLDDTPDVMHDLRVHPVGQPDAVARVEFSQFALYDEG